MHNSSSRPSAGTRRRRSFSLARPFSNNRFSGGRQSFKHQSGARGRRALAAFDVSRYINLNPAAIMPEEPYVPTHTFRDFGLFPALVEAIAAKKLTTPSPIQDQIIPHILNGRDVVGLAETGTGKTAAFLIPLINKTLKTRQELTLILAPTRELAIQVEAELRALTPRMHLYATVCVGGANIHPQLRGLSRQNHFIIGTPGRVIDLIERGAIHPEKVTNVILDEADRMLDMGFIHDVKRILKNVPENAQTLFFSATMSKSVEVLVADFLTDPLTVSVRKKETVNTITQDVVRFEPHRKFEKLTEILQTPECVRVLVFGAMKHSVERLARELARAGIAAESIHGNKSHSQRQRALAHFKSGEARVLVATDVAARGIHVERVSHVINYDPPATREDYIHRIGRTGRGSERGIALTFVPT
jgi:superfamily II DNA/RNA helicase